LWAAAAYWKLHHFVDGYAAEEMTSEAIWRCWGGTKGFPFAGLCLMWAGGALFWIGIRLRLRATIRADRININTNTNTNHAGASGPGSPPTVLHVAGKSRPGKLPFRLAFLCVLIGAAIWVYWAGDERRWPWAAGYRRFVVPFAVPFYVLCWLDYTVRMRVAQGKPAIGSAPWPAYPLYRTMGQFLAAVFALVLGIQSTLFGAMVRRLVEDMRHYPSTIVPFSAVPWILNTPMDHWAITDLAIAVQGKRPTQLLLNPLAIEQVRAKPPIVPNQYIYPRANEHPPPPNTNGWYDLRGIVNRAGD
jgi:hypothetical protein